MVCISDTVGGMVQHTLLIVQSNAVDLNHNKGCKFHHTTRER
jgi:hypothetical protein